MYRFVIEHPRWISPERLAELDVRAGADKGRIYRVVREDVEPPRVPRCSIAWRRPISPARSTARTGPFATWCSGSWSTGQIESAAPAARRTARASPRPEARMQALCTLDGLGGLRTPTRSVAALDRPPSRRPRAGRSGWPKAGSRSDPDSRPGGAAAGRRPSISRPLSARPEPGRVGRSASGSALGRLAHRRHARPLGPRRGAQLGSRRPGEILAAVLRRIWTRLVGSIAARTADRHGRRRRERRGRSAEVDGGVQPVRPDAIPAWRLAALAALLRRGRAIEQERAPAGNPHRARQAPRRLRRGPQPRRR